jgi:hypothetical protein
MSVKGCLFIIGGFLIGTLGLVVFIAILATGLQDMHKKAIVIEGEGACTLNLDKGDYTFFAEGTADKASSITASDISVSGPSGVSVTLSKSSSASFDMGNQKGVSIATFKAAEKGDYRLAISHTEGGGLMLMKDFSPGLLKVVGSSCAIFFFGGLIGLILVIAGIVSLLKGPKEAHA